MKRMIDSWAYGLGRILVGLIFVYTGYEKLTAFSGTARFMAAAGMPWVHFFLVGAIIVELGGGLALSLGFKARLSAWVLFLFLIPTTCIFMPFWRFHGPQFSGQFIEFLKNLSIMGGLLMIAASGAGSFSIDSKRG